ncbi:MAG TPA: site-2 protease family protein [Herpetosiphonaceae bacterium]
MFDWLWVLTVIPSLGFLIFVHELGHFLTALKLGIKVEEFGFGYPPRILTLFHWRGVPVTLNWLPLGGFVRMAGEEGNFEVEGSLATAPPWKKIPVMAAGAVMNILTAIIIFALIMGIAGEPDAVGPVTVASVAENSPAAQAQLQSNDVILALDGQKIDSSGQLRQLIAERAGSEITLDVQRTDPAQGTTTFNVKLTPRTPEQIGPNEGAVGVSLEVPADKVVEVRYTNRLNPIEALIFGVQNTFLLFFQMLTGIGMLLGSFFGMADPSIRGGVAGPVGIARMTGEVARTGGLISYMNLTALISVNLALINLLPFPALDGSRIVFALIEWVRRGKRVPPEKEAMVHALGMIALLGLMLLITFSDIRNIWIGRDAFGG